METLESLCKQALKELNINQRENFREASTLASGAIVVLGVESQDLSVNANGKKARLQSGTIFIVGKTQTETRSLAISVMEKIESLAFYNDVVDMAVERLTIGTPDSQVLPGVTTQSVNFTIRIS